jgi:cytochrome c-type biogenesis protein CcsB
MTVDPEMSRLSDGLVLSAMAVYTVAFVAFAADLSSRGRRVAEARAAAADRVLVGAGAPVEPGAPAVEAPERRPALGIALTLTYVALALHVLGALTRGLAVDRVPWGNMYEYSVTGTAVVTAVYVVLLRVTDLRYLGTFVVGPVLLSLGLAATVLYAEPAPLMPALQSFWLVIHVSVAFIASALFTIGFSLTVVQLVQERREKQRAAGNPPGRGRFMDALPKAADLELSAYRVHAVAFPLWSFTLIAGAIWAEKAWSRYWNWDPKEVWSFVIWTIYAAYLHARATRGWGGRRAPVIAIVGFVALLVNYLVVNFFFVGNHSYAGVN